MELSRPMERRCSKMNFSGKAALSTISDNEKYRWTSKMSGLIQRTFNEYRRTMKILPYDARIDLLSKSFLHVKDIISTGKLTSLDRAMTGNYAVHYRNNLVFVPVNDIDCILAGTNDSPTFSTIREMFANDVYLRRFRDIRADIVVDLGANRSLFMLIANKVMKASKIIGVEPQEKYDAVFRLIQKLNLIEDESSKMYWRYISSQDFGARITMQTIMHTDKI